MKLGLCAQAYTVTNEHGKTNDRKTDNEFEIPYGVCSAAAINYVAERRNVLKTSVTTFDVVCFPIVPELLVGFGADYCGASAKFYKRPVNR